MGHNDCRHEAFEKGAIAEIIQKYDCYLAILEADDHLPAFVYSIGLYERFIHPEIICFGLDQNVMADLINDICSWIRNGNELEPYTAYSHFLEDYDVQFLPADKAFYKDYFGYGIRYYEKDFPALQMVWPDKDNNFPWDEKFNSDWKFQQPLLDRNIDFKFFEERNLGVYTTKQVIEGQPVLYVYHDNEGDWQFHATDDPDFDNAKLICLEEIVKLDPAINELYDLKMGWSASRKSIEDKWEYLEYND